MRDVFSPLPIGARDLLPATTRRRRAVTDRLLGVFERWGYREIAPPLIESNLSATLYALFRADAWRLYTLCQVSGMKFNMAPLPQDLDVPPSSMMFDVTGQLRMFAAGYDIIRCGNPWRNTPPGYEPGEEEFPRTGTCFTVP